jgi:hypothetical protein
MEFEDLDMKQLREVGYLLEEYVDHEVRGISLEGLRESVSNALLELSEDELHEVAARIESKLGVSLIETDSGDVSDAPVQPERGDSNPEVANPSGPIDEEHIIQIRCHPTEPELYNGDVIASPKPEIVARYIHSPVTLEQARSLVSRGYRWNTDPRYSEKPNRHP